MLNVRSFISLTISLILSSATGFAASHKLGSETCLGSTEEQMEADPKLRANDAAERAAEAVRIIKSITQLKDLPTPDKDIDQWRKDTQNEARVAQLVAGELFKHK